MGSGKQRHMARSMKKAWSAHPVQGTLATALGLRVDKQAEAADDDEEDGEDEEIDLDILAIAVLRELNSFEYFVDVLDQAIVPRFENLRRSMDERYLAQCIITAQKHANKFRKAVDDFQEALKDAGLDRVKVVNHFVEYEQRVKRQAEELRQQGFNVRGAGEARRGNTIVMETETNL